MKKYMSALMVAFIFPLCAYGAANYMYTDRNLQSFGYDTNVNYTNSNLQGYAVYVPAGVTCKGILSQSISSRSAVVGQNVNVVLVRDFIYNGKMIAPAGSVVYGSIVSNQKASMGNRNAKMMIRFTTIVTPYGNTIPVNAVIATSDLTGVLIGESKKDFAKENIKDTAPGAGTDVALGVAMGALSSGSIGKGIADRTTHGAGSGYTKGVADKDQTISIPANSTIELYYTQPITFTAQ